MPVRIDGAIVIHRSPEDVFDFVADERNEPRYNPKMIGVRLESPPPIGKGAKFIATMRWRRRTLEMLTEFTEFERPKRLGSISAVGQMRTTGGLSLEPADVGTRLSWSWTIELHGLMRLAAPLVSWMGRRQERAIWGRLKAVLESSEQPFDQ
jgi:carbon monoxide dehydrogenase subunit G